MRRINSIIFFAVLIIGSLTQCKKDENPNPVVTPTVNVKIGGVDFTPTSSKSMTNKNGLAVSFSSDKTMLNLSINKAAVGIYNIGASSANIAEGSLFKEGKTYSITSGSIEIVSLANNIVAGKYTLSATSINKNMNEIIPIVGQFDNMTVESLAKLISGTYIGKCYGEKDSTFTRNDSLIHTTNYRQVSSNAIISESTAGAVNISASTSSGFILNWTDFSNLQIQPYSFINYWVETKPNPQDTTLRIEVPHYEKQEQLRLFSSFIRNDSLKYKYEGIIENNNLDISGFSGIKQ
jgi:hypothetical protein